MLALRRSEGLHAVHTLLQSVNLSTGQSEPELIFQADPQYFRNELMKMRNDPRQNPNHGRSMEDQEFWNEAARLPWAKVLLRKEQFWTERRNAWLPGGRRMKKSAAYFWDRIVLVRLKHEPEKQAQMMQEELDGRLREAQDVALKEREEQEQQLRQQARTIIDMDGLRIALEYGQKCRKDGLVEYHRGNWDEALHSWRRRDLALRRFRAPLRCEVENGMLRELHGSVLRNLSQAALRAGCYQEALDASERAIALQGGRGLTEENAPWDVLGVGLEAAGEIDVKAWFRRHVALEALGQMQEAASCLQYIEEAAMGRADGERLRTLEAQEPILAKWGFEASIAGAQELRQAIKEQTARDADLKELSDKVSRALYGSPDLLMYERVRLLLDADPQKDVERGRNRGRWLANPSVWNPRGTSVMVVRIKG
eukprot:g29477.t1